MLIDDWDQGMSIDAKIEYLLKYYAITLPVKITEHNKEMILEMLNRHDVNKVSVDDGEINIEHYGD
jgi:hypothetical protein